MISFIEIIYGCIVLQHLCSDNIIKNSLKTLNDHLVSIFDDVSGTYANLQNNPTLKLSSGEKFDRTWNNFSTELEYNLRRMNYECRIVDCIESFSPICLKQSILFNKNQIITYFEKLLLKQLYRSMDSYTAEEIIEIGQSLNSESFFNLTNEEIDSELVNSLKLGKKFTPRTKFSQNKEIVKFNNEIVSVVKSYLKTEFKVTVDVNPNRIVHSLRKMLKINHSVKLIKFIKTAIRTYEQELQCFKTYIGENCKNTTDLPSENFYETIFKIDNDKILIEGDKNVGYVCMFIADLKKQYEKINFQQHFGKVNIDEDWYISNILDFIKQAELNLPTELSKIIIKSNFKWVDQRPEIGVLRLQPKILKLKEINHANVVNLTSRGIKSSMKDPIKIIQKILDKLFNHLLYYVENEFNLKYSKWSPSVCGIDEAISRIKDSKTGNWGLSVEIEGDFSDLYSNCNKQLLMSSVNRACKFASFSDNSINYINILIECIMNHSYFKEPEGMFQTLKGFSMGDCSAARGSELILRVAELDIFKTLSRQKLLMNVN